MTIPRIPDHIAVLPEHLTSVFFPTREAAMVYGFAHCHYLEVADLVSKKVQFVYLSSFGDSEIQSSSEATSSLITNGAQELANGNPNEELDVRTHEKSVHRLCKAALVNLVAENVRRYQEGEVFIPVIFCIDCKNNPYSLTVENLLTKNKPVTIEYGSTQIPSNMNLLYSHSELRRIYKLCYDEKVDLLVRSVALETFHFVRVSRENMGLDFTTGKTIMEYNLKEVDPPWREKSFEFEKHWKKRKETPGQNPLPKSADWREFVNKSVQTRKRKRDER